MCKLYNAPGRRFQLTSRQNYCNCYARAHTRYFSADVVLYEIV